MSSLVIVYQISDTSTAEPLMWATDIHSHARWEVTCGLSYSQFLKILLPFHILPYNGPLPQTTQRLKLYLITTLQDNLISARTHLNS